MAKWSFVGLPAVVYGDISRRLSGSAMDASFNKMTTIEGPAMTSEPDFKKPLDEPNIVKLPKWHSLVAQAATRLIDVYIQAKKDGASEEEIDERLKIANRSLLQKTQMKSSR